MDFPIIIKHGMETNKLEWQRVMLKTTFLFPLPREISEGDRRNTSTYHRDLKAIFVDKTYTRNKSTTIPVSC